MTEVDPLVTHIDLVRHGSVATPNLFCAPSGESLSVAGWQQLETTTRNAKADVIISSPSRRCNEFATYHSEQRGCSLEVIDGFQEMDFGLWIGQSTQNIWVQDEALLQTLWQTPLKFNAPGGEAMPCFIERVQNSWLAMIHQHVGKRVLLFSHGGVIRVLLALALGIPYQKTLGFDLAYGSATRMRVYVDGGISVYGVGVESL